MRQIILVVILAALFAAACTPTRYAFMPVKVEGGDQLRAPAEAAGPPPVPDLPPRELFLEGYDAFRSGDRETALRYFQALIERHPQAVEFSDAAYNVGLLYQRSDQHEKALEAYALVVSHGRGKDITDARFRMLVSLHELKRWEKMLAVVAKLWGVAATLPEDDRLELAARRGVALFHLDRVAEAETLFNDTFYDYQIGIRRGDVVNEIPGVLCSYYLGMIFRQRFDAVELTMTSQDEMLKQMGRRALNLQTAQDWFLKCIQQDNVYWATAAGHQIGRLYRDFFAAIREVAIPAELSGPEEIRMYRCMLFDQVKVLLRKAMRVYEQTLDIGLRLRVRNRWTEQTRQDLEAVENLYLEEEKACEDVLPVDGADSLL